MTKFRVPAGLLVWMALILAASAQALVLMDGDIIYTTNFTAQISNQSGVLEPLIFHGMSQVTVDTQSRVLFTTALPEAGGVNRLYRYERTTGERERIAELGAGTVTNLELESDDSAVFSRAGSVNGTGIERVDLETGQVETVSQGGSVGDPDGLAIDPTDGSIVACNGVGIYRVDPDTGAPTELVATGAEEVAVSPDGTIFVLVLGEVRRVNLGTMMLESVSATLVGHLQAPANDELLAITVSDGELVSIDPSDGTPSVLTDFSTTTPFFAAGDLAPDATGVVVLSGVAGTSVSAIDEETIVHYANVGGAVSTLLWGTYGTTSGVALRSTREVIVTSRSAFENPRVLSIDPKDGARTTIAQGGFVSDPRKPIVAENGDIILADRLSGVLRIDDQSMVSVVSAGNLVDLPLAVAEEPESSLLVASNSATMPGIARIETNQSQSPLRTGADSNDPFSAVRDVMIGKSGDAIVTVGDADTPLQVYRLNRNTGVETLIPVDSQFNPSGLANDPSGEVYVVLTSKTGPFPSTLFLLDEVAGTLTEPVALGNIGRFATSNADTPDAVVVPEPGGALGAVVVLALLAGLRRGRRQLSSYD